MTLDPTLRVALEVLEPYLEDIVIAGGWVPYLYATYYPPSEEVVGLKTRDLDLAVPRDVPQREVLGFGREPPGCLGDAGS